MFEEVSEDEFIFNGKTYVAETKADGTCDGCAFSSYVCNSPCLDVKCDSTERTDSSNVIFVEKQP